MALTKDKKSEIINDITRLLDASKLTVFANYQGTSVQSIQALRNTAGQSGTQILVIKNRLFKKAVESDARFTNFEKDILKGQLIYAFNPNDEVAPAQELANFAKIQPQIKFVGGLTADGTSVSVDDLKILANLPSHEQLRSILAGTIAAPLSGFVRVMSGNVQGLLNVLTARAKTASNS